MHAKHPRSIWSACWLAAGLAACGGGGSNDDADAQVDGGPTAGGGESGTGGNDSTGGGSGGRSGSPSNGGSGTGGQGAGGGSADMPTSSFDGLPTATISYGKAPTHCTERGSSTDDTLILNLTTMDKVLLLSGKDGALQINGVTCTAVAAPKTVQIVGTTGGETVIVDFSLGALPESLRSGTIQIAAGGGSNKDTIAVAATTDADEITLGEQDGTIKLRISGELPLLEIKEQETLIVSSGPGDDRLTAAGSSELGAALSSAVKFYAGPGNDSLQGGKGPDELYGGDEDDYFTTAEAADGGDLYDGGPGSDTLSYDKRTSPLTIKVDKQANDGEDKEGDNVQDSIETLIGGHEADVITAGENDNTLIGGPGNDTLNGGAGDDVFLEVEEALGADIMNGGPGVDTIDYSGRSAELTISLCIATPASCNAGQCGCTGDDGEGSERDALVNIENGLGGRGNDSLRGSSSDNLLIGNEGDDELRGEAGNDDLYGGPGNDQLFGGPGEDMLSGDEGNDTLDAGDGQGDICIADSTSEPRLNCELAPGQTPTP